MKNRILAVIARSQNDDAAIHHRSAMPLKSLITFALAFLITLPVHADWRPEGCRAKRTHSRISASAGLIMTVLGPEISVLKFDFLGAALAYSTQYGLGKTKPFLKRMIDKRRPCGCQGSFPSGHMIKYAASSSYLHYRYGWQYGFPAYALAFAFAHDRIRMEAHDWRDIFGTFAIINLAEYILIPRFNKDVRYLPEFLTGSDEPKVVKGKTQMQFRPIVAAAPKELILGFNISM